MTTSYAVIGNLWLVLDGPKTFYDVMHSVRNCSQVTVLNLAWLHVLVLPGACCRLHVDHPIVLLANKHANKHLFSTLIPARTVGGCLSLLE